MYSFIMFDWVFYRILSSINLSYIHVCEILQACIFGYKSKVWINITAKNEADWKFFYNHFWRKVSVAYQTSIELRLQDLIVCIVSLVLSMYKCFMEIIKLKDDRKWFIIRISLCLCYSGSFRFIYFDFYTYIDLFHCMWLILILSLKIFFWKESKSFKTLDYFVNLAKSNIV